MESQLADFERTRGIKQRWNPTDKEYRDAQHSSLLDKQQSIYSSLRSAIVKRQYLLKLKAKYAGIETLQDIILVIFTSFCVDGQKIAKRLSTGITKETASVRKLLSDFNTTRSLVDDKSTPVTLGEVLSPDADFWQTPLPHAPHISLSCELSWNTKKDIIQAYLLIKRCEEELLLLSEEKQNVLSYWLYQKEAIQQQLATMTDLSSLYGLGSRALLQKYIYEIELLHSTAQALFSIADDGTDPTATENWSPYSDSDVESLSDYED